MKRPQKKKHDKYFILFCLFTLLCSLSILNSAIKIQPLITKVESYEQSIKYLKAELNMKTKYHTHNYPKGLGEEYKIDSEAYLYELNAQIKD